MQAGSNESLFTVSVNIYGFLLFVEFTTKNILSDNFEILVSVNFGDDNTLWIYWKLEMLRVSGIHLSASFLITASIPELSTNSLI